MHLSYKDIFAQDLDKKKEKIICFDPTMVNVSDFKCDSVIPIMNQDIKKTLIANLEKSRRKQTSRVRSIAEP